MVRLRCLLVGAGGDANRGTLPGIYGDNGIFYSTAPETAFGTYPGSKDPITGDITNALTNNSGDTVGNRTVLGTPLNLWDAWQMAGYGIAGAANNTVDLPTSPLLDSNGRGHAPWGMASAVAGPESAYDSCSYENTPGGQYSPDATEQVGLSDEYRPGWGSPHTSARFLPHY